MPPHGSPGRDTARDGTRICSDTSSTAMQCTTLKVVFFLFKNIHNIDGNMMHFEYLFSVDVGVFAMSQVLLLDFYNKYKP